MDADRADADRDSPARLAPVARTPAPDFRYVALQPEAASGHGRVLVAGSTVAIGIVLGAGVELRWLLALGVGVVSAALATAGRTKGADRGLALVPWGLLVDAHEAPRALLWSAVRSVRVRMAHTRDGGNTSTLASFVTVETHREVFHGRTLGAAPLERLEAHLEAYAEEQATPLAFDLDGHEVADVTEPDCERLLTSARSWVDSADAHRRLGLHGASYRRASSRAPTTRALEVLRACLRSEPRAPADARAFAAVIAAELGATALIDDLLELVQSPHPLLAAVAKQAALHLGAPSSRAGSLEEVAPFLHTEDELALRAWSVAR